MMGAANEEDVVSDIRVRILNVLEVIIQKEQSL
jgi:hypothetical protein